MKAIKYVLFSILLILISANSCTDKIPKNEYDCSSVKLDNKVCCYTKEIIGEQKTISCREYPIEQSGTLSRDLDFDDRDITISCQIKDMGYMCNENAFMKSAEECSKIKVKNGRCCLYKHGEYKYCAKLPYYYQSDFNYECID